jgi:DNA-binding NarL/FixJ family response regulator
MPKIEAPTMTPAALKRIGADAAKAQATADAKVAARTAAIYTAAGEGMSVRAIAAAVDLSPGRVGQILKPTPKAKKGNTK